jgi:hypothetical protein
VLTYLIGCSKGSEPKETMVEQLRGTTRWRHHEEESLENEIIGVHKKIVLIPCKNL